MRDEPINLESVSYTPNKLLGETAFVMRARNNRHLAQLLEVDAALVCRIVKRRSPITETILVRIMDRTGWGIAYTRQLAGIPYEGPVCAPRPRVAAPIRQPRNYHLAKSHILQAMPGTVGELARKSGYARGTVEAWLKVLRAGDALTRASHIIDWRAPNGSGPYIAVHQAGPGEDAVCIKRASF